MPKDCCDAALSFLEHRARTAYEVKKYLHLKGFAEAETEEAMRYLTELGYLDDAGYCREYIRYWKNRGRGPVRLQYELTEKGIDAGLVRSALEEDFDRQTERDAALGEANKMLKRDTVVSFGTGPDLEPACLPDEKTVAKIGRKLASLGYHTEVIYEIVGLFMKSRETD